MSCAACARPGGRVVALACMHCVHPLCLASACPACGNRALDLASALEANGILQPGECRFLRALPAASARAPNDLLVSHYADGTLLVQDERDGKWLFVWHGDEFQGWCVRGPAVVHWTGRVEHGAIRDPRLRASTQCDERAVASATAFCYARLPEVSDFTSHALTRLGHGGDAVGGGRGDSETVVTHFQRCTAPPRSPPSSPTPTWPRSWPSAARP